jgi:hypothetical protein
VNRSIALAVRQLLESGNVNYDSYFEIVIKEVNSEALPEMFRDLMGMHGTFGKPYSDSVAGDLIALVKSKVGPQYTRLLMDPGIAFRADQFVEFALTESPSKMSMDPLVLRRKFINSFEQKYYYRATLPEHSGKMIARGFENAILNYSQITQEKSSYFGHLPVLENFHASVIEHILIARTSNSGLISISEHPEIAWYAVADNAKKLWKKNRNQFRGGIHIRRINLNSFYALPRTDLLKRFRAAEGEYEIGKKGSAFRIPVNDPSVELLVPVAIPDSGELRVFTPRYSPMRIGRSTFEIPKPEDWN